MLVKAAIFAIITSTSYNPRPKIDTTQMLLSAWKIISMGVKEQKASKFPPGFTMIISKDSFLFGMPAMAAGNFTWQFKDGWIKATPTADNPKGTFQIMIFQIKKIDNQSMVLFGGEKEDPLYWYLSK